MGWKIRLSENNEEYCKRYPENISKQYKENDAFRKRYTLMPTKTSSLLLHEELKKKNPERMQLFREKKLRRKVWRWRNRKQAPFQPSRQEPAVSNVQRKDFPFLRRRNKKLLALWQRNIKWKLPYVKSDVENIKIWAGKKWHWRISWKRRWRTGWKGWYGKSVEASFLEKFEKRLSFAKLYFFSVYIWNRSFPESSCLCEKPT